MASQAGNALSLIKAVLALVAQRRAGVLDVRADGLLTRIYFADGKPLFAEDEAPGETFGRFLMRQGVITNGEFVRVIDEMTRAAAGDNLLRFGEVAVALGVLTPEQVERGLGEQVCGIIARSLQRAESQWEFEPSPPAAKPARSFSLEINPPIAAALRQSPDTSMVAHIIAARPEEFVVLGGDARVRELSEHADSGATKSGSHALGPATHAARLAAEQAFQKGIALLRAGQMAAAAPELARASKLQPESLEYLLYAAWAKARGRSDIPNAADRQTLLEIAQRAKRRDPLFAFGSYVIGQIAMWGGDDATAKKWFYEALRLDPASEAGQQVRILARRGAPAVPSQGEPSDHDDTHGPASAPTSERAPVVASSQYQKVPSRRWSRRLVPGAALLATALVVLALAKKSAPSAGRVPSASPVVSQPKETSASSDGPSGGPTANELVAAKKAPEAIRQNEADGTTNDAKKGTVRLPARASGHRIFVDGRSVKTDGVAPLHLRCGPHVIQIGSSGTPEDVDLPCRGEVQLQ
jgi:tetratricopeptide (TPR) repeat protein